MRKGPWRQWRRKKSHLNGEQSAILCILEDDGAYYARCLWDVNYVLWWSKGRQHCPFCRLEGKLSRVWMGHGKACRSELKFALSTEWRSERVGGGSGLFSSLYVWMASKIHFFCITSVSEIESVHLFAICWKLVVAPLLVLHFLWSDCPRSPGWSIHLLRRLADDDDFIDTKINWQMKARGRQWIAGLPDLAVEG